METTKTEEIDLEEVKKLLQMQEHTFELIDKYLALVKQSLPAAVENACSFYSTLDLLLDVQMQVTRADAANTAAIPPIDMSCIETANSLKLASASTLTRRAAQEISAKSHSKSVYFYYAHLKKTWAKLQQTREQQNHSNLI